VIRVLGVLAAFVRRDAASELSYRLPFALDLASTALSLALFFYLGRFIDRTGLTGEVGVGTNYFSFLITGLLLLTVAGTALGAFAGRVREDQVTGTFEALLAAPISPSVIIAGSGAYAVLRQAAELVVSVALAVIVFGVRPQLGWEAAVVVLVALPAFLVFFAAAGIAIAALTVVVKKVTAVLGLVTSGLALLGGVYYPVSVLPQPLEAVAQVIPFTWGAEVVRAGLFEGELRTGRLIGLVVAAAVALPVSLWLFDRAIARAKRSGTLAQY
jgi:ABC-2 type transport system permease protein